MGPRRFLLSALARVVRSTILVDRAYRLFDRARSKAVLQFAPAQFFGVYNDIAFAGEPSYRAGTAMFRAHLFSWERQLIEGYLPQPPAAVLVGAAGGGRESFELARLGYEIVAFEPAIELATSMARACSAHVRVQVLTGRYEDLPVLRGLSGQPVDLREHPPFGASLLGWASLSNLRSEDDRLSAVRGMANLTDGPIIVSFFPAPGQARGHESFSASIGYFRTISRAEIRALAEEAALDVLTIDDEGDWGFAVLRRRE